MRLFKLAIILAAAIFVMAGTSFAFHSGGVAECGGCHSMHTPASANYLLVAGDQGSTCLSCHEHAGDTGPSSYHISTAEADMPAGVPPLQRTPGGDFGWVKKTFTFVVRGTTNVEEGETHGHNIVATDNNYVADTVNTTAPGGTFVSANLSCNSCHDPHGKFRRTSAGAIVTTAVGTAVPPIKTSGSYNGAGNEPDATAAVGTYRLLPGSGYANKVSGVIGFPGSPAAKVNSTYNRTEAATSTRVAYGVHPANGGATWGSWCATCHAGMHSSGNIVHPIDNGMQGVNANYNAYVKTGDLTGSSTTSFTSLVPFATNSSSSTTLASIAGNTGAGLSATGPSDGDQVMCLSCHRAHASGNEFMLRWDQESTFITVNGAYPTGDAGRGKSAAEALANYYDRPASTFATYQRSLCNKCHVKD